MKLGTITIDGENFLVREITMYKGTPEEHNTLVGGTDLSSRIMLGDDEGNCRHVDEQIIFYIDPEDLTSLSDKELTEYVTNQING